MSVSQLVKRQEGPQTCLEGPSRYISTMDMLATPQPAHKGEVETAKGRPTTSKGCPTLHDFAKFIMQCPTKIKDIPYTPQSLAVGQATWYSHNQHYIVGHPCDERDIPSDTSLARKCINAGLHSNTEKEMCTSTCLQYNGMSLQFPTTHRWDVLPIAHPAGWWDVPRVPYSVRWDVPAVSYCSQMGHPSYHPFSRNVGHPLCTLLSIMGCPCGLLLLTDGTSHLLPIQQECGTSLVSLTQYNGMSLWPPTLTDGTSLSVALPIAWDIPCVPCSAGWWDVPHVPYSVQWDVPAVSYHSQMGHPSYHPFSRNVGRPSCPLLSTNGMSLRSPTAHRWDIPFCSTAHCVGRPSCALAGTMGCPCSLLPLTYGTSLLYPIQQECGTSLMCLTQYKWDVPC
jgi:hypothetical protein